MHTGWTVRNPGVRSSDPAREILLDLQVDLVSDADRAAVVDSVRAGFGDGMADLVQAAMREVPVDTMPHFKDLLPGAGTSLWLLDYRSIAGFKTWSEVDRTGGVLRAVAVPNAFDATFASESSLWGICTDSTGLRSVKRYTFR